jgi:hypothetical protein
MNEIGRDVHDEDSATAQEVSSTFLAAAGPGTTPGQIKLGFLVDKAALEQILSK